jgi:hypothetical protein
VEELHLLNMKGGQMALKSEGTFIRLPEKLPAGIYQPHIRKKGNGGLVKKILLIH